MKAPMAPPLMATPPALTLIVVTLPALIVLEPGLVLKLQAPMAPPLMATPPALTLIVVTEPALIVLAPAPELRLKVLIVPPLMARPPPETLAEARLVAEAVRDSVPLPSLERGSLGVVRAPPRVTGGRWVADCGRCGEDSLQA